LVISHVFWSLLTWQQGYSALLVACSTGNVEILQMLLQHGADVSECDPVR
jgi:ankyrin repeat protein